MRLKAGVFCSQIGCNVHFSLFLNFPGQFLKIQTFIVSYHCGVQTFQSFTWCATANLLLNEGGHV